MPGTINPGGTYRIPAFVHLLSTGVDPDSLTLTVTDPQGHVVSGFPVVIGDLVHDSTGHFHYDWDVDPSAVLGEYAISWAGLVGVQPIAGSDTVDVEVGAGPAFPMQGLLDPDELASIREIGELGMQTAVEIWRSVVQPEDPDAGDYDATTDYGDDQVNDPVEVLQPDGGTGNLVATVYGWFYSQLQTNVTDASGQLTTLDIHILRLPVGVDVRPEDYVRRVDNGSQYTVIDTNNDDTWPEWQKVTLRRRE